jgi:hypothetical protein
VKDEWTDEKSKDWFLPRCVVGGIHSCFRVVPKERELRFEVFPFLKFLGVDVSYRLVKRK